MLEPYARKPACTVLRGRGGSDASLLPDPKIGNCDGRFYRSLFVLWRPREKRPAPRSVSVSGRNSLATGQGTIGYLAAAVDQQPVVSSLRPLTGSLPRSSRSGLAASNMLAAAPPALVDQSENGARPWDAPG